MVRPNGIRKSQSISPPSASLSPQELIEKIEAGRKAAADFRHEEAITHFEAVLASRLLNAEQRATVYCSLAESLEGLARYREAADVMAEYETPQGRAGLHPVVLFQVWLRMGSVYGYAGDHPRAISYLKSALPLAEERNDPEDLGACHLVLGRIYRAIGETQFARDHLRIALQHHRHLGQWLALAQTYFLLGGLCISEGDFRSAREHFEQAIKVIGDHRAPLLLGSIYTNLSSVILFQEHGQVGEAIEIIERAIFYLKQAKNDRLLAYAHSTLGLCLVHIGDWDRAEQALNYSIELGRATGDKAVAGGALDNLGELFMLRGEFAEAERILALALESLQATNALYGEAQAYHTLGRCRLLQGNYERAIEAFEQELAIATKLQDQREQAWAQLYLAEVKVETGDAAAAQQLLDATSQAVELSANVTHMGQFRLLSGRLRAREGRHEEARHQISQAVAIFEMIADPYREAVTRYHLGKVWAEAGEPARARKEWEKARDIATRLGAQPIRTRIEEAMLDLSAAVERKLFPVPAAPLSPASSPITELSSAAVLRLAGAASSRELLLHELVTLIHESCSRGPVVAFEEAEPDRFKPAAISGGEWAEAIGLSDQIKAALSSGASRLNGATLHKLRANRSQQLVIYIGGRGKQPSPNEAIEALLRLAEVCLELCVLRLQTRTVLEYEAQDLATDLHLPGLIFSSPAMGALVANIHKIRSSSVTALITGESGTGKEVVARAIHALSERRHAAFVPFNCTIAPKEIIDSQLFGHRKGAFTGATSDYQGVIRSAANGTLFLDEIGDLALEVQPKLLRFLQEGEIQPLGETKLTRVDVRIVAATNSDLERLVAEGKFREDLYYRLNVIRLHIPPLRERREEIPLLVEHFLKLYSEQSSKESLTISPQALDLLMVFDWPGNVRQLANEMQRLAAYTSSGEEITEQELSPTIFRGRSHAGFAVPGGKNLAAVTNALLSGTQSIASFEMPPNEYPLQLRFKPGQQTLSDVFGELERHLITESMRRHKG